MKYHFYVISGCITTLPCKVYQDYTTRPPRLDPRIALQRGCPSIEIESSASIPFFTERLSRSMRKRSFLF